MTLVITAVVIVIVLAMLYFAARRHITLCELSITKGKITVARGGISPAVLSDLRDVVRRARVKSGTVRILRAKDHARIEASRDLDRAALQAMRNIVGTVSLAKLATGAGKRR